MVEPRGSRIMGEESKGQKAKMTDRMGKKRVERATNDSSNPPMDLMGCDHLLWSGESLDVVIAVSVSRVLERGME
jgi:hypothetical protein